MNSDSNTAEPEVIAGQSEGYQTTMMSNLGFGYDCVYEFMYRTGIPLNNSQDSQTPPMVRTIFDFSYEEMLHFVAYRRPSQFKQEENIFFMQLIDWVCKDQTNRGQYLGELISKIDLFRLSAPFVIAQFSHNPLLVLNQQCSDMYLNYIENISSSFEARALDSFNGVNLTLGTTSSINAVTTTMKKQAADEEQATHSHNTRRKLRTTNNSQQTLWKDLKSTTVQQPTEKIVLKMENGGLSKVKVKRARKTNKSARSGTKRRTVANVAVSNREVPTTSTNNTPASEMVSPEHASDKSIHTEPESGGDIPAFSVKPEPEPYDMDGNIVMKIKVDLSNTHIADPSSDSDNDFITIRSVSSEDIPSVARNDSYMDVQNVSHPDGPLLIFSTGTKARKNYFYTYNFQSEECNYITDTSSRRYQSSFTMCGNIILDIGGHSPQGSSTKMEIFDTSGIITPGEATFSGWKVGPQMKFSRTDFALVNDNGSIYVLGGVNILVGKTPLCAVEKLQPEYEGRRFGKWQKLCQMPIARRSFGAAALNGYIYAVINALALKNAHLLLPVGGCDEHGDELASASKYNIDTDTWTEIASLNLGRKNVRVVALGNRIYAVGGSVNTNNVGLNSVEVYDPEIDQWSFCADMSVARNPAGAVAVNGKLYVFGGEVHFVNSIECYSPQLDTWESVRVPLEMESVVFHCVALYQ